MPFEAGPGEHGNVAVTKRGKKPKAKVEPSEDPDDGLPDWMGAG